LDGFDTGSIIGFAEITGCVSRHRPKYFHGTIRQAACRREAAAL
jgi:hypothetical protein